MTKQVQLETCPFCGAAPRFSAYESGFTALLRVLCLSCGASSKQISYSTYYNDLDDEKNPIPPLDKKLVAALHWNVRHKETINAKERT